MKMAKQYLVEILLPLFDRKGARLPARLYRAVRAELVAHFGGMTAHLRAPVTGLWKPRGRAPAERDLLIIYEVMTPRFKRSWWSTYREELEVKFRQKELVVRAHKIHTL